MSPHQLEGIFAIIFSLSIPIIAIILGVWSSVKKKQSETELRRLIIENNVDSEQAKLLIAEQQKKHDPYKSLRWACVLCGIGIGTLANFLMHVPLEGKEKIYFWLIIAAGAGIGLLVSFAVEMKLSRKNHQSDESPTAVPDCL